MNYQEDDAAFEKITRRQIRAAYPTLHKFHTCSGKNSYSKKGALHTKASGLRRGVPYLRVYRCPTCRNWHLTHKKRWK